MAAMANSGRRKKYEKRLRHAKKSGTMASTAPSSGLVRRGRQAITRQMMPAIASRAENANTGRRGRPPVVEREVSPAPVAKNGLMNAGSESAGPRRARGAEGAGGAR